MIIIACIVFVHVDIAGGDGRSGIDIDLTPSNDMLLQSFPRDDGQG